MIIYGAGPFGVVRDIYIYIYICSSSSSDVLV